MLTILPWAIDPFSIEIIALLKRGPIDFLSKEMALMLVSEKEIPTWGGFKNFGGGKYLERNPNFI
jgi:hypothetical protein